MRLHQHREDGTLHHRREIRYDTTIEKIEHCTTEGRLDITPPNGDLSLHTTEERLEITQPRRLSTLCEVKQPHRKQTTILNSSIDVHPSERVLMLR